jgi:hypothetical protein
MPSFIGLDLEKQRSKWSLITYELDGTQSAKFWCWRLRNKLNNELSNNLWRNGLGVRLQIDNYIKALKEFTDRQREIFDNCRKTSLQNGYSCFPLRTVFDENAQCILEKCGMKVRDAER